jgi:hypothetical protein
MSGASYTEIWSFFMRAKNAPFGEGPAHLNTGQVRPPPLPAAKSEIGPWKVL